MFESLDGKWVVKKLLTHRRLLEMSISPRKMFLCKRKDSQVSGLSAIITDSEAPGWVLRHRLRGRPITGTQGRQLPVDGELGAGEWLSDACQRLRWTWTHCDTLWHTWSSPQILNEYFSHLLPTSYFFRYQDKRLQISPSTKLGHNRDVRTVHVDCTLQLMATIFLRMATFVGSISIREWYRDIYLSRFRE